MENSSALGLCMIVLGGIFQAVFMLPAKWTKAWKFEHAPLLASGGVSREKLLAVLLSLVPMLAGVALCSFAGKWRERQDAHTADRGRYLNSSKNNSFGCSWAVLPDWATSAREKREANRIGRSI
jgi:hypothetical protein